MDIGTITTIEKTDSGLVCTIDFGANDVEKATLYGLSSVNEWPLPGDEVAVATAGIQNVIVAVYRDTPDGIGSGETITYSRDGSGNVAASVHCKSNGEVVLNGGTDYATAFNELKIGFDALKTFVNTLQLPVNLTTLIAGPPAVPSTASIDGSKVEKVRI